MDVKKHFGARRLAAAALLAAGIAAGAACGTPVQFRTAAPPAPAAPAAPAADVLQKINDEAGSAWAARAALAQTAPSAEVLQKINLEAGSAWAARAAVDAEDYSEIRKAERTRLYVARQAGRDHAQAGWSTAI
jgi:hypothetical protein